MKNIQYARAHLEHTNTWLGYDKKIPTNALFVTLSSHAFKNSSHLHVHYMRNMPYNVPELMNDCLSDN